MPFCLGSCLLKTTPSRVAFILYSGSVSSPGGGGSSSALTSSRESRCGAGAGVGSTGARALLMLMRIPGRAEACAGASSCTFPSMEDVTVGRDVSAVARINSSSAVMIGSSSIRHKKGRLELDTSNKKKLEKQVDICILHATPTPQSQTDVKATKKKTSFIFE